jgi:hypothetical protein
VIDGLIATGKTDYIISNNMIHKQSEYFSPAGNLLSSDSTANLSHYPGLFCYKPEDDGIVMRQLEIFLEEGS